MEFRHRQPLPESSVPSAEGEQRSSETRDVEEAGRRGEGDRAGGDGAARGSAPGVGSSGKPDEESIACLMK